MGLYRGVTSPFAMFPRYHSAPTVVVVRAAYVPWVIFQRAAPGSPRVKLLNGERTNVARRLPGRAEFYSRYDLFLKLVQPHFFSSCRELLDSKIYEELINSIISNFLFGKILTKILKALS